MDYDDIKFEIGHFFKNRIRIPYYSLKCGIKNLIFYFKVIWTDRWWDFSFTYYLLDRKLEQMERHWDNASYIGSNFTLGRIKIIRKRLRELEDKLDDLQYEFIVNKKYTKEEYKEMVQDLKNKSWGALAKNINRFWD